MNAHSIEMAAFQSKNSEKGGHDRIDVPLEIVPKTVPGILVRMTKKSQEDPKCNENSLRFCCTRFNKSSFIMLRELTQISRGRVTMESNFFLT